MPQGETMFKFHGYSGPCPTSPLSAEVTGYTPLSPAEMRAYGEGLMAAARIIETTGMGGAVLWGRELLRKAVTEEASKFI